MTEDQILNCTDADLPKMSGEVFDTRYCKNCTTKPDICTPKRCCYIPIPLTWDNAMKWRDWAVEKFGYNIFRKTLVDVYFYFIDDLKMSFDEWIITKIRPSHYIKAAMLCAKEPK